MEADPLFKRLEQLEKEQKLIVTILLEIKSALAPGEGLNSLIDPLDLCKKLNMSDRNLRRLKQAGVLVPLSLGSRHYYLESEVMQALKDNRIRKK